MILDEIREAIERNELTNPRLVMERTLEAVAEILLERKNDLKEKLADSEGHLWSAYDGAHDEIESLLEEINELRESK